MHVSQQLQLQGFMSLSTLTLIAWTKNDDVLSCLWRLLSKQVLPVLLDTVKDVIGKDVRLENVKLTGSFICTPCFREMEKLKKLVEEQLKNT